MRGAATLRDRELLRVLIERFTAATAALNQPGGGRRLMAEEG
jgi:hypothetical protein